MSNNTPTDDEREALDYAIRCAIPIDLNYRPLWELIRAIQDSVLAAGFRHHMAPEGEPSDAQVEAALQEWWYGDHEDTWEHKMRAALRAASAVDNLEPTS